MKEKAKNRIRRLAGNLLVSAVAVLVLVVILEVSLGIAKVNTRSFIRFVPGKGITNVPGAYYTHTKEGYSEGYFNSHGFRDSERAHEKPETGYRIAVFGDSFTEALQVDLAESFPAILEKKLRRQYPEIAFEVLNFGQSGFGTTDSLMRYRHFGADYAPDMVILAFAIANDFRNNHRGLNFEAMAYYYVYDEGGDLVLDTSLIDEYTKNFDLPKRIYHAVKRNSYLVSLVSERIYFLRKQLRESRLQSRSGARPETQGKPTIDRFDDLNIYQLDLSEAWQQSFEITRHALSSFRHEVEQCGSDFVLVSLPAAEQVHPEVRERVTARYGVDLDYEQPIRVLEEIAVETGISHLKLLPDLVAHHLGTGETVNGFDGGMTGHWNDVGHRVAAAAIFEFLVVRWGATGPERWVTRQESESTLDPDALMR